MRRVQQDTSLSGAPGADPDLSWPSGRNLRRGPLRGPSSYQQVIRTAIDLLRPPRTYTRAAVSTSPAATPPPYRSVEPDRGGQPGPLPRQRGTGRPSRCEPPRVRAPPPIRAAAAAFVERVTSASAEYWRLGWCPALGPRVVQGLEQGRGDPRGRPAHQRGTGKWTVPPPWRIGALPHEVPAVYRAVTAKAGDRPCVAVPCRMTLPQ